MKKVWIYIILIVFEITLALAYGFWLQNIVPIGFCFNSAIAIPFTVLLISFKEKQNMIIKCKISLFFSLVLMSVFLIVFFGFNKLHGEFIDEYDVVVEYVNYRGGGCADFTTPQGDEGSVELHDHRPIIIDDDCVEVGDLIRVQEYKGIFNQTYYVFIDEIQ